MLKINVATLLVFLLSFNICLFADSNTTKNCEIVLSGDTLILENEIIKRTYHWNSGDIETVRIHNKETNQVWDIDPTPDLFIPELEGSPNDIQTKIYEVEESLISPYYKAIEIKYSIGSLDIKRVIRLYPNSPAIVTDYYFKGQVNTKWIWDENGNKKPDYKTLENLSHSVSINDIVSVENLHFTGLHWEIETVSLFDNTDRLNTLVNSNKYLSFSPFIYKGNILFAKNKENNHGIFMLKEAPSPMAQLNYPGGDYVTDYGKFKMIGIGLSNDLIKTDRWVKGYSSVVGVAGSDKSDLHKASLQYQLAIKQFIPERDNLIMANTWGDGNKDGSISEQFILKELEAAEYYGITHYQIDDGWQQGLSLGSVTLTGNNKWDSWEPEDWTPNKKRFPNGFTNIKKSAKEKNIELGLWFNPSKVHNFIAWESDADILINIYKEHGIKYFKIDGMLLDNKESEENFVKFLEKIKRGTKGNAIFNLDVTLNKRFGYLFHADYGTIFVENRYTNRYSKDPNYYPYWTLRNFWSLSRYVPAQKLQIEFPNKWNNSEYYSKSVFGPIYYDFEYLFAITMMGQPLAWFEPSSLPDEAKPMSSVIKKYGEYQNAIHNGLIIPIGDEPSGRSWTGFQSISSDNTGFLLLFREDNDRQNGRIKTELPANTVVKLKSILGGGNDTEVKTSEYSEIKIKLKNKNSYVLYQYEIL